MRSGSVVIGANFGDEGKGLITDYLVRKHNAHLNVRFNGGAQAGHTVVRDGRRHVFGHVGAGTFAGSVTHLSSRFLVNPILLDKELKTLKGLGFEPIISVSENARVSTIYDMALNSIAEIARGGGRHGSCGVGINETVTRHAAGFKLTVRDLFDGPKTRSIIERIQAHWVPQRMKALVGPGVVPHNEDAWTEVKPYFDALNMPGWRVADMLRAHLHDAAIEPEVPMTENCHVVFEGAQGLMLDEFMGNFPHVTRSMTGLPYAIEAADEIGVRELYPVYVTRSYLTRHGAGLLSHEGELNFNVNDLTNVSNPWQGTLRFAPLDLPSMAAFIKKDWERAQVVGQMFGVMLHKPTIALTWADIPADRVNVIVDAGGVGARWSTAIDAVGINDLLEIIEEQVGFEVKLVSGGPEAKHVKEV